MLVMLNMLKSIVYLDFLSHNKSHVSAHDNKHSITHILTNFDTTRLYVYEVTLLNTFTCISRKACDKRVF